MLQSQQVMADPSFLGANYQLGNHKATYKPSTSRQIIVCSVALVFGVAWTVGVWQFVFHATEPLTLAFVVVGLLLIGFALWNFWRIYRNRVLHVFIYDDGLIYVGRGSAIQTMRWQDIEAVKHNVVEHSGSEGGSTFRHHYTVNCFDGSSLTLDQTFSNVRQLGKTIEVETAHYLYPLILSTYRTTSSAIFGPLVVVPQGLYHRSSLLHWGEIKSINIDDNRGRVTIKQSGKLLLWASVPLRAVPNIEVFRMLIEHVTGVRP
ncbi:hypothetical protein KSF_071460 [Reticulibacter mediterranei]|uniref:Uncharacterized protein n=1 Tax=Reticulibacter mediterranei TaxID=2778369 RepID=A0A8J3IN27_9CHLR|nr:DUF6585 family protein [Reticulibacter mediterranei]GHO97098.1 hypothetical protein KSF_071460 [Reticulibacter mediterranei]